MDKQKLQRMLELHEMWLEDKSAGARFTYGTADSVQRGLSGADLWGAVLRMADLYGADLRSVDLRFADLRGADLRRADLSNALMTNANMAGADLTGANIGTAVVRLNDFKKTKTDIIWGY